MNPKRGPGLKISVAGDETLVHDPGNGKVHVLNSTAGKVLELCDGTRTVSEIAVGVANAFLVDTERVRPDLDSIIADFTNPACCKLSRLAQRRPTDSRAAKK